MQHPCHGSNVIGFTMESWITFTPPPRPRRRRLPRNLSLFSLSSFSPSFTSLLTPRISRNSVYLSHHRFFSPWTSSCSLDSTHGRSTLSIWSLSASSSSPPPPTPVLFGFAWRARRNDRIRQRETGPRWFERPVDGWVSSPRPVRATVWTTLGKKLG